MMQTKKERKRYVDLMREKKDRNISRIFDAIGENGKLYSEIKSEVGLSDTALSKHLEYMQNTLHWIKKKIGDDNKPYYVIDEETVINPADVGLYGRNLTKLGKDGADIFYDYSGLGIELTICSLPWGIDSNLIMNRNLEKLKLLRNEDVEEIEKLLFKKITDNVNYINLHRIKFRKEGLELLNKDNFVLSFNVNMKEFYKSIKSQSLAKLENMSPEEIASYYEADSRLADG